MKKLKIYAHTIENEAVQQVNKMNGCDAYKDCTIRIMPDCHAGMGCTIGTVIAVKDRIVPNTVGVDIGCGMLVIPIQAKDINLQQLDEVINECVPSGFNIHEKPVTTFPNLEDLRCKDAINIDFANRSLGSLGGGNHFIELNENPKGSKFLVIHSGSRNLGVKVCDYYQKKAVKCCKEKAFDEKALIAELKAQGRQREIESVVKAAKLNAPKINTELAYLEGKDLKDYLHDMNICQQYASVNRHFIAYMILKTMGLAMGEPMETIHNYIDITHKILRKGAVSALNGQRLIIPMNMRDGSLICRGKGNIDWLYSAPHGAGRIMSRRRAKETLNVEDFKQSMEGIYTTSVCESTLDEAPMVYKPMQEIIECIEPTVEVLDVIKPLYNFKAKQ